MTAKQLRLPKCGDRRYDNHPRAHLFATMHLLGQVEDRALDALEAAEWDDDVDDGEYLAREVEVDRAVDQSATFYAAVIAPVYRQWWR